MANKSTIPAPAMPTRPTKPKWQLGDLFSGKNRRRTQTYNEDYAMYQWNMENWYNHPANQMARYGDADLNRNLIYGQATGNTASPVPNTAPYRNMPDLPTLNDLNPLDKLSRFADVKMKLANVKNVEEGTAVKGIQRMLLNNELTAKDLTTASGVGSMGVGVDVKSMSVRQRREWEAMQKDIANAKSAKQQTQLQEKLLNWYTANQISSLIMGGMRTLSPLGK